MRHFIRRLGPGLIVVLLAQLVLGGESSTLPSYAVVVSRATNADPQWHKVVEALVTRHQGKVIEHDGSVDHCLPDLKAFDPRFACFVAQPSEATREFVMAIHRLTRKLNDDPYGDVVWGIVTGAEPTDALRVATMDKPLVIRHGGAGTSLNLGLFDSGSWFNEAVAGEYWTKDSGGDAVKHSGPADSTKEIVDYLNDGQTDLFMTSGHASEHDWMLGYTYPNGRVVVKNSKLFGLDRQKHLYPIHSENPKVLLSVGNCLMGHIDGKSCMALGWIGSGGVDQMLGYTVVTWYGEMGWGAQSYLFDSPGQYSVAESFFFSNQCILHELATRFPKSLDVDLDIQGDDVEGFAQRLMDKVGPVQQKDQQDQIGLIWDRDVVAFYGDPAWDARLDPSRSKFHFSLTQDKNGPYRFTIHADADATFAKPPAMLLPQRLHNIHMVSGQEFSPLITENFIMLFGAKKIEKGNTIDVTFTADRD